MKKKQSKIIAFVNQKGGVAKTTTTINTGAALTRKGYKVLLVDCDAQGSLTLGVDLDDVSKDMTTYELFTGKATVEETIKKHKGSGYDVVPADLRLSGVDLQIINVYSRELILKRALEPVITKYDYILIDCPPSLSIVTLNCLSCATDVVIPLQAQFLALNGVFQLLNTIGEVKKLINPGIELAGVLLTMYESRAKHTKEIDEQVEEYFKDKTFKTVIRKNIALADAPARGQDIFQYDPHSNGAKDYESFTEELLEREMK